MTLFIHPGSGPAALLAAAALVLSAPAAAQVFYAGGGTARADASGFGQSVSLPIDNQSALGAAPVGTVTSSRYALLTGGTGSVGALAQTSSRPALGGVHLQAYTRIEVHNGDPTAGEFGYTVAEATGQFADAFFLNVPGYAAGTLFTVTAGVQVDAINALTPTISNNVGASTFETVAAWTSRVILYPSIGGQVLVEQSDGESCAHNQFGAGCTGSGGGSRTFSFTMPNQSWAMQLQLVGWARTRSQANVIGGGGAYVTGLADLGHTIGWGGISTVVDPAGNVVSGFSAVSTSSGFDYRNAYVSAVPEPASPLLLLLGAGVIAVWKRRRKA